MEAIEFFGYLGALLIGVVLGLIGGGGSILTVPLLVYLLNINPVDATAYSLFLVGITALFGTIQNTRLGLVDFKTAFIFSLPAFSAVYMTRAMVVPNIPEIIYKSETLLLTKEVFIMVFFAAIMILAAITMIRDKKVSSKTKNQADIVWIALEGIVVGFVTGIVGAGGGFFDHPCPCSFGRITHQKGRCYFLTDHCHQIFNWVYGGSTTHNRGLEFPSSFFCFIHVGYLYRRIF